MRWFVPSALAAAILSIVIYESQLDYNFEKSAGSGGGEHVLFTVADIRAHNQNVTRSTCLRVTNGTAVISFARSPSESCLMETGNATIVGTLFRRTWGTFWPLFVPDAWGPRNSRHLTDPFTLTHVHHGTLWYIFMAAACTWTRGDYSMEFGLVGAIGEAAWEIRENSPAVIGRFRKGELSKDYQGDALINSFGDWAAAMVGFWICVWLDRTFQRSRVAAGALLAFLLSEALLVAYQHDCMVLIWVQLLSNPTWLRDFQGKESWARAVLQRVEQASL